MVTTVIPTIGRGTLWTRALPSLMAQTVTDWRCIIVGDGVDLASVDDPRVTVTSVPAQVYPDEEARWRWGGVDALAWALELAGDGWVSYLADDDAYEPIHHEALLAAADDDVDVVYGQSRTHLRDLPTDGLFGNRWPPEPFDICQGSYILRASLGMRPTKPLARSWDAQWWMDLLDRRARFRRIEQVVHRYHPDMANLRWHTR